LAMAQHERYQNILICLLFFYTCFKIIVYSGVK
jgi:hypothetical protein